ncbi:MAG TPA: VWA domain-containing protein [Acidobacteriaceae bacterium]
MENVSMLLCLVLLVPGLGRAQQQPQTSPVPHSDTPANQVDQVPAGTPGYTLQVHTQLVQLDVVVRNAKGELVPDLHAGDFTVTEDDAPQRVVSFDATSPNTPAEPASSHIESTAELDQREPNAPVTILVLDELTARFEDQYFARYSLERYLSKQGEILDQPMTLIARTIERTMVLSDYTTSKKKILDALNRHLVGNDWRANNANFNDVQVSAAFASLLEVAKATQGHPGHKNLVWIGRGFPSLQWQNLQQDQIDELKAAVSKCVDLLRESRVTLYVIDPAGVQGISGTSDENGMVTLDDPFAQDVSFDSLARATGGVSMHGRNDVDHLIGDAVAGGETFYTLAYRPSSPADTDPAKFRRIKVTLKDSSLTATSREGYYPRADRPAPAAFADAKGKLTEGTLFDLSSASTGLMVFDGIPLTLNRQGPSMNEVQVSFPASSAGLTLSDGKLRGDVTLIALSFDLSGKLLTKEGRVVALHLAALQEGQVENRSIHITTPLNTQLPIARMRIVIRANSTGKIGADNVFLAARNTLKDRETGVKPH